MHVQAKFQCMEDHVIPADALEADHLEGYCVCCPAARAERCVEDASRCPYSAASALLCKASCLFSTRQSTTCMRMQHLAGTETAVYQAGGISTAKGETFGLWQHAGRAQRLLHGPWRPAAKQPALRQQLYELLMQVPLKNRHLCDTPGTF